MTASEAITPIRESALATGRVWMTTLMPQRTAIAPKIRKMMASMANRTGPRATR